jgi:hypothetical protein
VNEKKTEKFLSSLRGSLKTIFFRREIALCVGKMVAGKKGKENNQNFITAENYILFLSLIFFFID